MNSAALPSSDASRHMAIDAVARDDWVEAKLMRSFMRSGLPGLRSVAMVIPIIFVVLYGDVNEVALFCWTLAAVATTLWRYRVIKLYHRRYAGLSGVDLRAFLSRYSWTWTLSAVVWGSSMLLYFRKAPVYDQFICLIVLAGMAGFAVGAFSASLRCFIGYINGLAYSVLAAVSYSAIFEPPFPGTLTTYGLFALVLIYWSAIRLAGKRFHRGQRVTLELQFANAALIASLTEKTRTAMEAVQIKNRFIASAAHDLRQPVHALSLYADWLQAEPELVAQIAPKIVRSTQAVNELFNSLFDLAKLDSGVIQVNWQRIDLPSLIAELELQHAPVAIEKGLELRTRVLPAEVLSDPVLLKRLVGNLLSNAIRHTEQGGVLLAVRRRKQGWCVEVWDTGVGIAPEHQEAIFQEFYRVAKHNGTEEGFGLGLSIVSRLGEALNHPVRVHSRVGQGTVFRVELPVYDDKADLRGGSESGF
ncbi:HAMP domain-containing sensor histidine kinase [Polaromonas sp. A23]|uniref:sensor histidine kinase n=1 Tax=Polaromonas sp. A23 TaxID=1944133 RepID=UPI000985CA71|nr:HAMP domain-containing sensor histidine kinase [Polaromonas sp. A23]OOG41077.1 two-component sensor histidine kinase [Polaromonas sp. A23]